jgi:hypothetical protein
MSHAVQVRNEELNKRLNWAWLQTKFCWVISACADFEGKRTTRTGEIGWWIKPTLLARDCHNRSAPLSSRKDSPLYPSLNASAAAPSLVVPSQVRSTTNYKNWSMQIAVVTCIFASSNAQFFSREHFFPRKSSSSTNASCFSAVTVSFKLNNT